MRLVVDDERVAMTRISRVVPFYSGGNGIEVGENRLSPVSSAYAAPIGTAARSTPSRSRSAGRPPATSAARPPPTSAPTDGTLGQLSDETASIVSIRADSQGFSINIRTPVVSLTRVG